MWRSEKERIGEGAGETTRFEGAVERPVPLVYLASLFFQSHPRSGGLEGNSPIF